MTSPSDDSTKTFPEETSHENMDWPVGFRMISVCPKVEPPKTCLKQVLSLGLEFQASFSDTSLNFLCIKDWRTKTHAEPISLDSTAVLECRETGLYKILRESWKLVGGLFFF